MELDKNDDVLKWTRSEWPAHIPRIGYSGNREKPAQGWRETVGYLASSLALVGILIYGMLSISYDAFYRPLGIDPNEVGLNYGKVLGQSTGIVVFLTSVVATFIASFWLALRLERSIKGTIAPRLATLPRERAARGRRRAARRVPKEVFLFVLALELLVFTTVLLTSDARNAATAVKHGRPITFSGRFVTYLPITADPVMVEPVNETVAKTISAQINCDSAGKLPCREKLMYMGQANGIAVLYNVPRQRRILLPLSSVVLHISNCRTQLSSDTNCDDLFKPGRRSSGRAAQLLEADS